MECFRHGTYLYIYIKALFSIYISSYRMTVYDFFSLKLIVSNFIDISRELVATTSKAAET